MTILNAKGKSIRRIYRGDFLIDGIENEEDLGPIQIEFDDQSILQIELVADGESVDYKWLDSQTPKINTDDNRNVWDRIDLSNRIEFTNICSQQIEEVDTLFFGADHDEIADMVIAGYGFRLVNGNSLVYYNAGDFAKILINEVPPSLSKGFRLEWKKNLIIK